MKRPVFLLICLAASLWISMTATDRTIELASGEEEITVLKTEYIDLGDSGTNRIWSLSPDLEGEPFQMCFNCENDTLECAAQNTLYSYHISGDTLYLDGFANRLTAMEYHPSALSLPLDINYGDSIAVPFKGHAVYSEKLGFSVSGVTEAGIDASGKFIVGTDTIGSARRLRISAQMSTRLTEIADSLVVDTESETARDEYHILLVDGLSYPVIISKETVVGDNCNDRYSLVYLPEWQYEDFPDRHSRTQAKAPTHTHNQRLESSEVSDFTGMPIKFLKAELVDDMTVSINYSLSERATLEIIITDVTGRAIGSASYTKDAGEYVGAIRLHERLDGNVVVGNVRTGSDTVQFKIMQ